MVHINGQQIESVDLRIIKVKADMFDLDQAIRRKTQELKELLIEQDKLRKEKNAV
jgi:hypothetical protein